MNSFELSRNWFNFSFENPELINPNHSAIYFFAIEHCNRLGNKDKFGFPTTMVMEAIGIKSYNTYIKSFSNLVDWGFIKLIEKSKNQYSSNIIALSKNNKAPNKALDKALIKHTIKHSESTDSIIKQETKKQINKEQEHLLIFDSFRILYQGKKKGNETEFATFKKHKDWAECLELLLPAIKNQITERDAKSIAGKFVPEWKNLSTWLNQRCWEEETEFPLQQNKTTTGDSNKEWEL